MTEIKKYNTPIDFLRENQEYIYGDYFSHYHLIRKIEEVIEQKTDIIDGYNIVDDKGSYVLCMWVTGTYFIYGSSWTSEIVAMLSEAIKLKKFKHFSFCGQRELIIEFFKYNQITGKVFKNRFIEVCESVNSPKIESIGHIEHAHFDDLERLVQMSYDYNQEEFFGQGSQTFNDVSSSVKAAIFDAYIYVWRVEGIITSIAQVINRHDEFALIGSLYTKKEYRGYGYGYFLMQSLTKRLLEKQYLKCGLVSDADNFITKKIFERVGYKPIYSWVLMRKED